MSRITIKSLQDRIIVLEEQKSDLYSENYDLKEEKKLRFRIATERTSSITECLQGEVYFLRNLVRAYAKDETLKLEIQEKIKKRF